MKKKSRQAGKK